MILTGIQGYYTMYALLSTVLFLLFRRKVQVYKLRVLVFGIILLLGICIPFLIDLLGLAWTCFFIVSIEILLVILFLPIYRKMQEEKESVEEKNIESLQDDMQQIIGKEERKNIEEAILTEEKATTEFSKQEMVDLWLSQLQSAHSSPSETEDSQGKKPTTSTKDQEIEYLLEVAATNNQCEEESSLEQNVNFPFLKDEEPDIKKETHSTGYKDGLLEMEDEDFLKKEPKEDIFAETQHESLDYVEEPKEIPGVIEEVQHHSFEEENHFEEEAYLSYLEEVLREEGFEEENTTNKKENKSTKETNLVLPEPELLGFEEAPSLELVQPSGEFPTMSSEELEWLLEKEETFLLEEASSIELEEIQDQAEGIENIVESQVTFPSMSEDKAVDNREQLIKGKEVLNKPIICITEGKQLGRVLRLGMDRKEKTITSVVGENQGKLFVLPIASIFSFGGFSLMIESQSVIEDVEEVEASNDNNGEASEIIGLQAVTERGALLGMINDYGFHATNGRIAVISVEDAGIVRTLLSDRVICLGKDFVIVRETWDEDRA